MPRTITPHYQSTPWADFTTMPARRLARLLEHAAWAESEAHSTGTHELWGQHTDNDVTGYRESVAQRLYWQKVMQDGLSVMAARLTAAEPAQLEPMDLR